ncbi:MAG: pyrroloquinoline quinone biosynthesis peptide chaperone PqqD [Proteobacteria bacterium]|nr:pyrroloquinoline quinone biosynthesis peptide chaperone PqqD [Pseudomonadota bacterium]MBS0492707.1 pyrroloquinoline quinone biosynthesis peptide chaperone PqqD [Pseudomonadota bacterium]
MNFNTIASVPVLPQLSPRLRLQYESALARWVLLHPDGREQLNDSAAEILRRCDGRRTVADIVNELEALFDTQGVAPQVLELIEEGRRRGWLD